MKRTGDMASMSTIASLFRRANKKASPSSLIPAASPMPMEDVAEEVVVEEIESMQEGVIEEIVNVMPSNQPPPVYDINRLPQDPGERVPIADYPVNDQDAVRRAYILKGPFQDYSQQFNGRLIGGRSRSFNPFWFHQHHWLEYSAKEETAFCFVCYLFKEKKTSGKGTNAFTDGGWSSWNRDDALGKHIGGVTSVHNKAQEKYNLFVNPRAAIDDIIVRVDSEDLRLYKIRLKYSLRCLKFLLHQGLAFRGHDESEESSNRGNFVELLKLLATNSEEVNKYVLHNAPHNCTLISHGIQSQIIQCCALQTRKQIIEELGDDYYAILADESSDVSHKEQLALCLRYVDKLGRPREHFIGVVHVSDTTSLSLKKAIEALLKQHHLAITQIRGQGYDGASNMRGEIKGLKTLIMKESPSAYYVHCFAHQLQLVLVFHAHLMLVILGYTNELSECLQRRDQDILAAIDLVQMAKNRMQELRSHGWDAFLKRVTSFCNTNGIQVPVMEDDYVSYGRSSRFSRRRTNDYHFRREVYLGIVDQIIQELDNRFDEINMELLSCMSALSPANSFAAFDAHKVRKLAEFYPNEFKSQDLIYLELQLDNYIDDMRRDEKFKDLQNLVDLSVKLVETRRHIVHNLVYLLLKLVLLLPVATANVERAFSAMSFVKSKLRNKMGDSLLDDCLVTYIERDTFSKVDEEDVIETFMAMTRRRPHQK